MSRETQIEEMAKVIEEASCGYGVDGCHRCEFDGTEDFSCAEMRIAKALYNAGYRKIPDNIGEFSDGYHTFNELYHHRAVLFSVICNIFPEKAWKSKLHDTGDMYDGMFIVGIDTEQGQATYHYDIEPYWDMFKVKELEKAPKWDGHTPADAIQRIGSISGKQSEGEWVITNNRDLEIIRECSNCHSKTYFPFNPILHCRTPKYCEDCGAKMKGGAE